MWKSKGKRKRKFKGMLNERRMKELLKGGSSSFSFDIERWIIRELKESMKIARFVPRNH
jgi:hypothetical protein